MHSVYKKIIISIVTYKSRQFIEDCLDSLVGLDYPKHLYKVVISDNNTTDGTVPYIRNNYPNIEIIENKANLGFSGGHNIVLNKAINEGYDYVAVVNYDTVFDKNWLKEIVAAAEKDPMIGSVQSKTLLWPDKHKLASIGNAVHFLGFGFAYGSGWDHEKNKHLCEDGKEIPFASGACVLLRMSIIKEIGGFNDEMFAYHEDSDLGWRVRLHGYKNVFSDKSIMYHKYDFHRSVSNYYFLERNRLLLILQNYRLLTLLLLLPANMIMEIGLVLFSIKNKWIKERIRVYKYFLKKDTWQKILKERRQIKKIRKISDKQVMSLFKNTIDFQEIDNPLLKYIGNPFLDIYGRILKLIIVW